MLDLYLQTHELVFRSTESAQIRARSRKLNHWTKLGRASNVFGLARWRPGANNQCLKAEYPWSRSPSRHLSLSLSLFIAAVRAPTTHRSPPPAPPAAASRVNPNPQHHGGGQDPEEAPRRGGRRPAAGRYPVREVQGAAHPAEPGAGGLHRRQGRSQAHRHRPGDRAGHRKPHQAPPRGWCQGRRRRRARPAHGARAQPAVPGAPALLAPQGTILSQNLVTWL